MCQTYAEEKKTLQTLCGTDEIYIYFGFYIKTNGFLTDQSQMHNKTKWNSMICLLVHDLPLTSSKVYIVFSTHIKKYQQVDQTYQQLQANTNNMSTDTNKY